MRRLALAFAVTAVVAACGGGGGRPASAPAGAVDTSTALRAPPTAVTTTVTTVATTVSAGTPTTGAPAAALDAYLGTLSHVVEHTGPVSAGRTVVAVAARELSDTGREIDVLVWSGTGWATTSALTPPYPYYSLAALPIQVADVTGDGRPDFLVRVEAADNEPGVVVSDDGGGWRLVPFAFGSPAGNPDVYGADVYGARNPSFDGGRLTTRYDDCTPDCAQGTISTISWTYDRASGRFARA